jgi:hypothetical protein
VVDHDAVATTRFFEDEMICKFGVPKYIITNNESKWLVEFDELCKNYSIIH